MSNKTDLDQSNLEDAVLEAIEKRIGAPVQIFESANFGVVAFERLTGSDRSKVDFQEVAAQLARSTGIGVCCVCNADWTFDDKCDEEATFIAFDLPSVPADYKDNSHRNMIEAVDPETAPSAEDFVNARRARSIVKDHLVELAARRDVLIGAQKSEGNVLDRIADIETLKDLAASEREAVAAILDLDFDRAIQAVASPVATAPRM